ncbi:MAG: tetratricopeptide repeat protein [Nitrospina sp.]|jgi:tetratricopeptide (TPR) repeat protein|nr:tetratricopeptide repeat protein [Nitrospina sp.]MBT4556283.1 tetratricopeptide repeat protein [Nitrospina sp.]MBT5632129.1 tetratricopeptide repeat protein [Nitrospina sp.]
MKDITYESNPIYGLVQRRTSAGLLILCLLFLTNCATPGGTLDSANVDLSSSYAVRSFENSKKHSQKQDTRDPRSYYHYLMALQAEKQYQMEQAASHYKEVVQHDPEAERFHEKWIRLLLRTGQLDEAVRVGQSAIARFPENEEIEMVLGDILSSQGKVEEAIGHYDRASQIHSGNARAPLLKGSLLEQSGKYDQALEEYKKGAIIEPNNPLVQFYLGRAYLRANQLQEAEKSLEKAVSLKPNLLQARHHLAWVLERQGKTIQALKEYGLLLKLKPDNASIKNRVSQLHALGSLDSKEGRGAEGIPPELEKQPNIHMRIATIYFEQTLYMRALEEFQLVLVKHDYKDPHVLMARIYEVHGRLDKAVVEFEKLRKLEPESLDILLYTARLYSLMKNTQKAVELLSRAVEIEPDNDQFYHSLALAYMAQNENVKAIENMHKALALNSKKDSYYFELGALMEKQGDYKGAMENMRLAIELNPLHSNAHNFLGYMYALEGRDLDQALLHLKKALTTQPRNGYFLDSLGWIYFKKGESEKALTQIQKALIYTEPDPVLYDHLGDILFSLKNYDEASGAWKNSLFLTVNPKGDLGGEAPDPETLKNKINKARILLQQSY